MFTVWGHELSTQIVSVELGLLFFQVEKVLKDGVNLSDWISQVWHYLNVSPFPQCYKIFLCGKTWYCEFDKETNYSFVQLVTENKSGDRKDLELRYYVLISKCKSRFVFFIFFPTLWHLHLTGARPVAEVLII